jgi:hypothetical protein
MSWGAILDRFNLSIIFLIFALTGCAHKDINKIEFSNNNGPVAIEAQNGSEVKPSSEVLKIRRNDILPSGTWAEKCRQTRTESGKVVGRGEFLSLRSTYISTGSNNLSWVVSSYKDKACSIINNANRILFECETSDNKKLGDFICTQTKRETSRNLVDWKSESMVDHSGYSNIVKIYVSRTMLEGDKIKFTQMSAESEDSSSEILVPHAD